MEQLINYKEECKQLKRKLEEITEERNVLKLIIHRIASESKNVLELLK